MIAALETALAYTDGAKGGRPAYDAVAMFKVLILAAQMFPAIVIVIPLSPPPAWAGPDTREKWGGTPWYLHHFM